MGAPGADGELGARADMLAQLPQFGVKMGRFSGFFGRKWLAALAGGVEKAL